MILEYIYNNKSVSHSELISEFGISESRARLILRKLEQEGYIVELIGGRFKAVRSMPVSSLFMPPKETREYWTKLNDAWKAEYNARKEAKERGDS